MGRFVVFSGSPSYALTAVIPPQTETKFIRELYPMSFRVNALPWPAKSPDLSPIEHERDGNGSVIPNQN
ncbi:hypothetical protein TNCV_1868981 [Trichonephila clavipes]|nr:hypothetical protein TNCV_1868981 [Trichonephila clavipes]